MIDIIYIAFLTVFQVDVISKEWNTISKYAQDKLGRGATIISAQGGYHGDERIILRIVFEKRQYNKIRTFISKVDPKAFVTFTRTNAVFGEGFRPHVTEGLIDDIKKKDKK